MTTSVIDFRELRRLERLRIRNTESNACVSGVGDGGSTTSAISISNSTTIATAISSGNDNTIQNPSSDNHPSDSDEYEYEIHLPPNMTIGDAYRITGSRTVIDSVFYVPNFLPSINQLEILTWLTSLPEHSQHHASNGIRKSEREESLQHNGKWTSLKHAKRKVALFDGNLCNFPPILQSLSNILVEVGAFPSSHPPNHVLVNEYQPGEGIMPHTDGPAYESRTATISLGGSDVIFKLWPRLDDNTATSPQPETNRIPSLEVILHGNGSLILFTNDAYLHHCHEISEGILEEVASSGGVCGNDLKGGTLVTRGHRVSLTFRHKK